jgi:hypothetical protein
MRPAGCSRSMTRPPGVVCCLPGVMGDPGTAATGAVMRPATLGGYARQAGYRGVEILPLRTETWQFYRLTP